jgi:hypothetical protein
MRRPKNKNFGLALGSPVGKALRSVAYYTDWTNLKRKKIKSQLRSGAWAEKIGGYKTKDPR